MTTVPTSAASATLEKAVGQDATSRQAIVAEEIRLLMRSRVGMPLDFLNGLLVAALVWRLYPPWLVGLWLSLFLAAVVERLVLRRAYHRAAPTPEAAPRWGRRFVFGVFGVGCLWGLAGSVVLLTNSPAYLVFIVFVLGGTMAAGVVSHAAYPPAAHAFLAPTIIPLVVALLFRVEMTSEVMAFMTALFAVVMYLISRNINAFIVENFRLRIDQDILAAKLTVSEAAMAQAQQIAHLGSWREDLLTGTFSCSVGALHVLGLDPTGPAPTALDLLYRVHPDDRFAVAQTYGRWLKADIHLETDYRAVWDDGSIRWVHAIGERTADAAGRAIRLDVVLQDITERRANEEKLEYANVLLKTQMEASPDGILVVDANRRMISYNRRFLEMWNVPPEEVRLADNIAMVDRVSSLMTDPQAYVSRTAHLYDHPEQEGFDSLETTDGRTIDRHTLGLHTAEGLYLGRAWFFRDMTARKKAEAEALRAARFDALTGLANRGVFVEALQRAIARGERGRSGFAVIYLDLDHFKDINDTLGHPVGDELLKAVADRLRSSTREEDVVGRFGGDEFALVASGVTAPVDAAQLADNLIRVIGHPYTIAGNVVYSGASIGIDLYGPKARDAETLLSHADIALYRAKADGRGSYRFFTDAMDAEVRDRVVLAGELRTALDEGQLYLMYQPQVHIGTGRITGVEALVRWRHPTRGVLGPDEFIPMAEETGLVVKLGHWVLWTACRQSKAWREAKIPATRIAVNVSAVQFKAPRALEADLLAALSETGVPASLLELELTETVLMSVSREHSDVLSRLHELGLRIAIDDFGTGFSSLAYLRRYPTDRIKIAQTFIDNIETGSRDAAIVRATLGLTRELGIPVIAEGVERRDQLDLLKAWGCPEIQGHYFSYPLGVEDISRLLLADEPLVPGAAHGEPGDARAGKGPHATAAEYAR